MKYKSKPIIVDAFLWTGGPDQTEDPEWICEAIRDGTATISGSLMVFDNPDFHDDPAEFGDWIIRTEDGHIFSMTQGEFEENYEVA